MNFLYGNNKKEKLAHNEITLLRDFEEEEEKKNTFLLRSTLFLLLNYIAI